MLPLVSVIVPTYNRWPLVSEAVESVLAQGFKDFELIVVNDGSTDETAHELASFGTRLRLVAQPRRGVAAARNIGVADAKGRYIAFLDSDDLWRPDKLAVQTAYMRQNPRFEICQTEEIWLRSGVRVNHKKKHQKPSGDIFRQSLDLCLVSPSAVMMTKDLFERLGGFDETLPVCEDYDLWLRIAVEHEVGLIPMALVVKRGGHADQLSRSMWGMDRFRIAGLLKLLRAGIRGEKRGWAIETLKRKAAILAHGARKRGKEQEALYYEALLAEFCEEKLNVGPADLQLRERKRIPSKDLDAVVEMGPRG
jgi:glycosyltransferase involved in cell wall biosynthesis